MITRLQDCPDRPWKNGQGSTREIAVHPDGANGDDFVWRISIARVDSAAPFSLFPGIDRQIVLLDGRGFHMTLDDERTHALVEPFEPFGFPGESRVTVRLVDGATHDFNLMVRRALTHGDVTTWRGAETRIADADVVLVYCARGNMDIADGRLHEGDAWRPGATGKRTIVMHEDAVALVVRVSTKS
ncbi:HutD family protein [Rhodanobacter sp. L36]|uniref:HutD/Ves family protein n=1 Tax=Rhodanobacter sp. L36 TaxID=1747221 RepID=UPI00131B3734|nr:HutD family protein [Rhodanobacter sp. L36]